MTTTKYLDPCPFCGCSAVLVEDHEAFKIFCTGHDCDAQYGWCADKESAVRGWNRRSKIKKQSK